MSILSFLLKPKKEMAKDNTRRVRVGKYIITSHAQNRLVEDERNLTKKDMLKNLYGKNSKNSKIYKYKNDLQYDRINEDNRTLTHIIKKGNKVKTIHRFHNNKNGKKYATKNLKGEK